MSDRREFLASVSMLPGASADRLSRLISTPTAIDQLWACPWKILPTPDPWQQDVLCDPGSDWLLCCSRQAGKTECVSAKALWHLLCCGHFVMVISASDRQALEFHSIVMGHYRRFPLVPVTECNKHELRLANGARLLSLPNSEARIRVYRRVDLLVIDEASRVPDALFGAVRPMLAVSRGRTICLSTPYGRRGFFYKEWTDGRGWRRRNIPWSRCPRIPPGFVEDERLKHGDLWVRQEYECEFLETAGNCVFDLAGFESLIDPEVRSLSW